MVAGDCCVAGELFWSLFDSLAAQAKKFPFLRKKAQEGPEKFKYTGNFAQEADIYDSYDESS
jgi:hypothetical protein